VTNTGVKWKVEWYDSDHRRFEFEIENIKKFNYKLLYDSALKKDSKLWLTVHSPDSLGTRFYNRVISQFQRRKSR